MIHLRLPRGKEQRDRVLVNRLQQRRPCRGILLYDDHHKPEIANGETPNQALYCRGFIKFKEGQYHDLVPPV